MSLIIIIIIIIIIIFITFMESVYNCISERSQVVRVHSVAAVLYLQFLLHVMLFPVLICFVLLRWYFPKHV